MSLLHPATSTYIANIALQRGGLWNLVPTPRKIFSNTMEIFSNTRKKLKTHEAGSKKSIWPLLLTVVTNFTYVFSHLFFFSPEQRGWIVSEEKMKLLKSYWFSWHWPILRTFVFLWRLETDVVNQNVMVEIVLVKS